MQEYIKHRALLLIGIVTTVLYCVVAYFIERTDSVALLSVWTLLFGGYFYIISKEYDDRQHKQLLIAAVVFRLIFLLAIPALSDDVYRFFWDGKLTVSGVNPYLYKPSAIINTDIAANAGLDKELFSKLNSPDYYTVYPSVLQIIYWLAAKLLGDNFFAAVIIMRGSIILADIGSIYLLGKLLAFWKLNRNKVFIYALNPLIIIELTGNLHFEAVMIFFLLLSLHLLVNKKYLFAAIPFALSVCTKLLPLIMLPFVLKPLGTKRGLLFLIVMMATVLLSFTPFINSSVITHMANSVELYFQHFEFNASVYYIIREIGYAVIGYNIIELSGKLLPAIFCLYVLYKFFRYRAGSFDVFPKTMLWVVTMYYFLALVVHPWYISMLVVFALFTQYRFALLWSFWVGFTYLTYRSNPYQENLWVVSIEYLFVGAVLMYELRKNQEQKMLSA